MISDKDVFGDGVNIASRIQSLCDPGSIYISERVYDDIRNKTDISAGYIGEKHLKNINRPVKIYEIPDKDLRKPVEVIPITKNGGKPTLKSSQKKIRIGFSLKQAVIAGIIILLAAGIYLLKTFIFEPENAAPVPIAVISFENQTGDKNLDYLQKAIPNLIITNLEQSDLFQTIPWERMVDVMDQLGKKDVKYIDASMGFKICRREGYPFIVIGSFVKAGDVFVTDVKVLDVATKQIITSVSAKGNGLSSILESQVDELSRAISKGVGIPNRKLENITMRILDVTTSSLVAYDYFLKGRDACDKMYFDDARQLLEKAIQTDPGFAIAHLYLSQTYGYLKLGKDQNNELEKAYQTSSRATETEKLTIDAAYAGIIEKNHQKQLQLLLKLADKAPQDKRVFFSLGLWYRDNHEITNAIDQFNKAIDLDPDYGEAINQLAYLYINNGDYQKALGYLDKYVSLYPDDANPYDSKGDLYWRMGRLDDAKDNFKRALDLKPDFYFSAVKIAYIYAMEEDYREVNIWLEKSLESSPAASYKAVIYWSKAYFDYFYGKREKANEAFEKMIDIAGGNENDIYHLGYYWLKSWINYDLGQYSKAGEQISMYLQHAISEPSYTPQEDTSIYSLIRGLCQVKQNQIDSAEYYARIIAGVSTNLHADFNYNYLMREIGIAEAQSVEQLDSIPPDTTQHIPTFAFPDILVYNVPYLRNSLAEAYEHLGRKDKAIGCYQDLILFDPSKHDMHLVNPRYHYYLGILYQEMGKKKEAIEQFRKFLDLWQDADRSFKEPQDALKRLELLSAGH